MPAVQNLDALHAWHTCDFALTVRFANSACLSWHVLNACLSPMLCLLRMLTYLLAVHTCTLQMLHIPYSHASQTLQAFLLHTWPALLPAPRMLRNSACLAILITLHARLACSLTCVACLSRMSAYFACSACLHALIRISAVPCMPLAGSPCKAQLPAASE